MTHFFAVVATPRFGRLLRSLGKRHLDLTDRYEEALEILTTDPANRSQQHHIRKLRGVQPDEGQYRLRLGRWRFRYDIHQRQKEVVLHYCGLRREETYRR